MKLTWRAFSVWSMAALASVGVSSCGGGATTDTGATLSDNFVKKDDPTVTIHSMGDPDRLNPITYTSGDAGYITQQIFSYLLEYDPKTLQLVPHMAVARPEVKEITEGEFAGGMSLTFEIRPEAAWDNGTPVTADDYVFTIKAIKNPKVNAGSQRPYLEFIDKIEIDPSNNRKFTIYCKQRYFLAESSGGGIAILPEYVYDPNKLMRKFTVEQLDDPKNAERLSVNPDIAKFAEEFNAEKFDREVIVGSGAYAFKEWQTGQFITLERKKNWWGDKVKDAPLVRAYPPKITYKIINDFTPAIAQMKNEELDVMVSIRPENFVELREDKEFTRKYDLTTPDQFSYLYLGFNTKNPKFADKRVRRAFAHLVNRDDIIESLYQGLAVKVNSPINPKKSYYNKDLKDIEFDPAKAKALLTEAGWKDTDGNGIIDKVIDGKKVEMKIVYKYNNGNTIRKNIGLLLQQEAKRVGIDIQIDAREWTVFLEDNKKRDFELVSLAWVQSPALDDLKQIWHTSSDTPDGSNRVGFGNEETDKIIEEIRTTLDEQKRNELYKRFQEIVYEEQPYVFICVPTERISIHKRFDNRETSALRPGYSPNGLKVHSAAAQ